MLEFPWKKCLPFPVVPRIEFFKPDRLDKMVDNSGELKHVFDITPASLTKFAYDLEISKNKNIKI